jgi:hypothetical protein
MEIEKPSVMDILIAKGRIGLRMVVRVLGSFMLGFIIAKFLGLNIVGKTWTILTVGGYTYWFTGRPYSPTGLTHIKIAWQLLVRSKNRYTKPPEFLRGRQVLDDAQKEWEELGRE